MKKENNLPSRAAKRQRMLGVPLDLTGIIESQIREIYGQLQTFRPSTNRQAAYKATAHVRNRQKEEGLTFLTVTLPALGEWADAYLRGDVGHKCPPYWKSGANGFPLFLNEVWAVLMDGSVLESIQEDHKILIVWARLYRMVRTLLQGCKKIELPYTKEQVHNVKDRWYHCEAVLPKDIDEATWTSTEVAPYAQALMHGLLENFNPVCHPAHGPGAVAGRQRDECKWNWSTIYDSLHQVFPMYEYHFGDKRAWRSWVGSDGERTRLLMAKTYHELHREKTPVSRMVLVPKDSRGPRLIACEPAEVQWIQQGIARPLMAFIEGHRLTRGHVNFVDQTINQELAKSSSFHGRFATLDLSDASDRVSSVLVHYLFPENWTRMLFAARSGAVDVSVLHQGEGSGNTHVHLAKYAMMGSALTFPVESLVFWAISVATVAIRNGGDLGSALEAVYVYGDDIIVNTDYAYEVYEMLERFDLKVNIHKSFFEGPFRESCGVDAYLGEVVTPFRIRHLLPTRPSQGVDIVAWLDLASRMGAYFPVTSRIIIEYIETLVDSAIPRVTHPIDGLHVLVCAEDAWDLRRFSCMVPMRHRGDVTSDQWEAYLPSLTRKSRATNWTEHGRWHQALTSGPAEDPERVAVREAAKVRKRWVTLPFFWDKLT